MKVRKEVLLAILVCVSIISWSQEIPRRISISIPTIEQEATSIWRTINDIDFFEKHGYSIYLPKGDLIDSLLIKSKSKTFSNFDYSSIYELLQSDIYSKQDYLLALNKVKEQEQLINSIILQLDSLKETWNWDFKMFESYDVVFTLYGSGGSYDHTEGKVTLFATEEGNFKMYNNPINTIIHEIVHIGTEKSIIQQYNLPHAIKERIVDKIVFLLFSDLLKEYRIQDMGDSCIDSYLKEKKDIQNISKILEDCND